jgi:hypothetical protein
LSFQEIGVDAPFLKGGSAVSGRTHWPCTMRTAVLVGFKGSEMLQPRESISIPLLYHNFLKPVIAGPNN